MKLNKKGTLPVFSYLIAALVGILGFTFVLVFTTIFLSQARSLSICASDGNCTYTVDKMQTAVRIVPDMSQLIVYAVIFGALMALIFVGGIWGYNKAKGM